LACSTDVHVITPDGRTPGSRRDSVFTIHRLARSEGDRAELRRDLVLAALVASTSSDNRQTTPKLDSVLDRELIGQWSPASAVLDDLRPDLVVLVDHLNVGGLAALDRHDSGVPTVLLALAGNDDHLSFPHFDPVVERALHVLAVTENERSSVTGRFGREGATHRIGAPLVANASAFSEPNTWVGESDYLLVLTDRCSNEVHPQNELARLIRIRYDDRPVGIAHSDGFYAWHEGRVNSGWPVERSSDLARLMAFASVTVDLRSPELYGRAAVESLLYGTPIVVPDHSLALEHAQRGRGGLWFADPAELTWCIESLLDPDINESMRSQGRAYAEDEYGSTDRFIDRVTAACGLDPASIPDVVRLGAGQVCDADVPTTGTARAAVPAPA
jgi:glycosyltransferase involved in cell wall biosynthesis